MLYVPYCDDFLDTTSSPHPWMGNTYLAFGSLLLFQSHCCKAEHSIGDDIFTISGLCDRLAWYFIDRDCVIRLIRRALKKSAHCFIREIHVVMRFKAFFGRIKVAIKRYWKV